MTAEIKAKNEKLQGIKARVKATLEQFSKGLPAEKDLEVTTLLVEAKTLREEIESDQRLEAKKVELGDIEQFLSDPVRTVQHGVNGDDSDQKKLERAGWEFKAGLAYAPNSLEGTTYRDYDGSLKTVGKTPMFGADVILGDISTDDAEFARFQKSTRHAMSPEYRFAYVKFWRMLAQSGGSEAMALQKMSGAEQKALSEGTDTAGGFLVPPDVQADVLVRTAQRAVMRRLARVQTTNRDILRWPMVKPNATSGSIYSSGFVGGWAGEAPAFSDTDPGFQMFDIPIKKIRVATKISNDLISDAAFNVLAFLAQDGSQNMALVEDNGFIAGDGTALQPVGILNSGATTFDVEGTTANTISNTTTDMGSAPKIIAGIYLIPDQYVDGSVMLVRRSIEGKIAALVDGNGRPYWAINAGSGFGAPPRNIEGLPLYNSSFMPADGVDANKVTLVGNVAQAYVIGQRAQITTTVLRERFADTDQTGIIIWERAGGATWNVDAIRIGIV